MPYITSTAISRVEYSEQSRTLSIWFTQSGGPYDYYGVPRSVYQGLLSAASAGEYFNKHIRDQYSSNR